MASRKLLVVTGEYSVVQQVKQALDGKDFAIHTAYSHLDAVYQLSFEPFELVLVDADMVNRKTGERTAGALAQVDKHPPIVLYALKNGSDHVSSDMLLTSLDEETLRHAVANVLRLPTLVGEPSQAEPKASKPTLANTSIFWRDEEMQTLFALGRSLTEVLDLSEVLNRVVEAARSLTSAEEGMILLPDGKSGQLYLRAKVGIDRAVANNFRIKTHDTIAGTVFESGRSILLGESGPQKVKTEYFVNSLLYVPIIHKGQTLGVLGVNNKNKHDVFTERHQDLLLNLASYAAVAIENARVHGQSVRRTQELKALIDASQAINASLSFDHTLPAICEQLIRVLSVGHAELYSWDHDNHTLRLLARCQQAYWREGNEPITRLVERPVLRLAMDSRRSVFLQRERSGNAVDQDRLKQVGVHALLTVPFMAGDQVFGVLQAYYVQMPEHAPANDVIQRAQRLLLEDLANLSSSSDDGAPSFKRMGDINVVLGSDWIEFSRCAPESGAVKLQFAVGGGVWIDSSQPRIDLEDYADMLNTVEAQHAWNHFQGDDLDMHGGCSLLKTMGSRSLLALPLNGRGQTIGLALFADTIQARPFSVREVDLGRAIVGQAATALENVTLVHDLEASLHELQEAQNRLIQSARLSAMGELAAAVAHQINNPLTTIVLDTELLLEGEPSDTKNYEVLNAISRSGKRAAGVVRRLLAMARPPSPETSNAAIDVVYTIDDVVSLVRPHIEREGIQLDVELPTESFPTVWAVPGELNDVWLNLILNAHDAVIGQKIRQIGITIRLDSVDAIIEVIVWDNGPGIPNEVLGEIFKPFFTTKPPGEGTGLGLHICRQVVDRIGGTISVQTSASGTRFVVRLPIMRST